jgi:HAD superfamily hydrolase (TIGR01509 family)
MAQLKIIFFDVGKVLVAKHVHENERIAAYLNVDLAAFKAIEQLVSFSSEFSHEWDNIETLEKEEAYLTRLYTKILEELQHEVNKEKVAYLVNARMDRGYYLLPHVIEMLDCLSAHYRLGILSNALASRRYYELKQFGLLRYFDPIILSREVKSDKPEKKIFEIALKEAGVLASEAAFVDDKPKNLQTAAELGFQKLVLYNYSNVDPEGFTAVTDHRELIKCFVKENHV